MPQVDKPWRPFMVLVAGDTEWGARSLDSVLETSGYAVLRAETGREALELALSEQPHAVVLDAHTPDMPGVEVCRLLTGDPRFLPTTPIIMTTSDGNAWRERFEAYSAGAWELFARPFDGAMLLLKLQTFMRAKQMSERWREGSLLDGATGLYNMEGLTRRAREIGAHAFRRQEPVACVAFTPWALADDPRDASSTLSVPLVEHIANACRRNARSSDAIGRISDSQFAVIAPATDSRGAVALVERLRSQLQAGPALADRPSAPALSIRAGYCTTPNYAESLLSVADMVMEAASALATPRGDADAHVELR
ncbi:MAG TPA: response regulator [Gemmatimonadaceae bacterium]